MNKPLKVSDYIKLLNDTLSQINAKIIGEVSSVNIASSGHVYFSIKDDSESVLNCIIWKGTYKLLGVDLKEGEEIIIDGYPNVYRQRGTLSVIAQTIEFVGEGKLKKEYEKLKLKLTREGLFRPERKRAIPNLPVKIGIITSKEGAVKDDFLNNLGKFGYKIKFIDSRVEGQQAVKNLFNAIRQFEKIDIDVLTIMRGGGSLESFLAFNNEALVREIAKFPVPVITGIGHDKDVPLLAMAADKMVSTPTAVANLLNSSWEKVHTQIENDKSRIIERFLVTLSDTKSSINNYYQSIWSNLRDIVENYRDVIISFRQYLQKIEYSILDRKKIINEKFQSIVQNFNENIDSAEIDIIQTWNKSISPKYTMIINNNLKNIKYNTTIISHNDPRRQLRLGYSIAYKEKSVIKSVDDVKMGDNMQLQVVDGLIDSNIKKINKK